MYIFQGYELVCPKQTLWFYISPQATPNLIELAICGPVVHINKIQSFAEIELTFSFMSYFNLTVGYLKLVVLINIFFSNPIFSDLMVDSSYCIFPP